MPKKYCSNFGQNTGRLIPKSLTGAFADVILSGKKTRHFRGRIILSPTWKCYFAASGQGRGVIVNSKQKTEIYRAYKGWFYSDLLASKAEILTFDLEAKNKVVYKRLKEQDLPGPSCFSRILEGNRARIKLDSAQT